MLYNNDTQLLLLSLPSNILSKLAVGQLLALERESSCRVFVDSAFSECAYESVFLFNFSRDLYDWLYINIYFHDYRMPINIFVFFFSQNSMALQYYVAFVATRRPVSTTVFIPAKDARWVLFLKSVHTNQKKILARFRYNIQNNQFSI